jgi:hypothetical protein
MAEEVENYARRERQALETVLENAARYEEDYTRAEARSRDQLREAKQAYSLHHDFGYDNDEDAATLRNQRPSSRVPGVASRGSAAWPSKSWSKTSFTACASRSRTRAASSTT